MMKTHNPVTSFAMPYWLEKENKSGWIVDIEPSVKNNTKVKENVVVYEAKDGVKALTPSYLFMGFLHGVFDDYSRRFDKRLILNKSMSSVCLSDEQKAVIDFIVKEDKEQSEFLEILKSDIPFVKLPEKHRFVYQFLFHLYHLFIHFEDDKNETSSYIGKIFYSKIPLKYFDFVVQEMTDGKGYLIIQSILYVIKIEQSETNDSKVIEIEPLGITNPKNTTWVSFKQLAEDTTFGDKKLIEEIDFTPVKKWLDEKKAKEKLDVLKENISKLKSKYEGSEIDLFEVQEGETLRDVMTKYTVMASLIEKRIEEEEKKNTDNKVVTKEELAKTDADTTDFIAEMEKIIHAI